MSSDPSSRLSADEARALWERAMEMQLAAVRRAEEGADAASGLEEHPGAPGFTAEEVAAAAQEAGISPEYMAVALAEMQVARLEGTGTETVPDRGADRLLRDPRKVLERSRTVEAEPKVVLEAMQALLPNAPFHLTFRDMRGKDPLVDGVLVFETGTWSTYMHHQTPFTKAMLYAELDLLLITLREGPLSGGGPSTEITVRAPLRKARRSQWWWSVILGTPMIAGAGGGGMSYGLGMGAALGPTLSVVAGLAIATVGVVGMGAGGVWGCRKLYRWGLRKGEEGLDLLLNNMAAHVRSGGLFRPPGDESPSRRLPGSFGFPP